MTFTLATADDAIAVSDIRYGRFGVHWIVTATRGDGVRLRHINVFTFEKAQALARHIRTVNQVSPELWAPFGSVPVVRVAADDAI